MPGVVVRFDDEPIDKLLRVFKKQVERAGLMYDIKKREHYLKPSVKKVLKSREARRRASKDRKRANKR